MRNLPIILCLEDARLRIDWLREQLRGEAEVRWTWRVSDFLHELETLGPRVACIVLDHDIPPPPLDDEDDGALVLTGNAQNDEDGKCGYDAALALPVVSVPVLVWSVNTVGAERMIRALRDRGIRSERMPHLYSYYDYMLTFFRQALAAHR